MPPDLVLSALILLFQAQVPPDPPPRLADLGFMAGCWEGSAAQGIIEEHYTLPTENLILGTTRYVSEGRTTFFEFTRIEETDDGIVMTPYPTGRESEPFRLTHLGARRAVFENPEHDFPKRIVYRRDGAALVARIDAGAGSAGSAREWRMLPTSCRGPKG